MMINVCGTCCTAKRFDCVQAVDAVYFNGGDAEGNYMVAATARRHDNLVQTTLLLRVGDGVILIHR